MSPPPSTERIVHCVAEYRALVESGAPPPPEAFRERLGEDYPDFLALLAETSDGLVPPAAPADETFPRAFGPFLLLGRLGAGGMGVVYDALHRALGRRVAVKVLHDHVAESGAARERFQREARACARIRHPNVVEIYDAGDVEGRAYYSMALLEGTPLDRLAGDERPSTRDLLRGFAAVADALDTMHREGVVHRDVKPGNIMLRPDGHMVLADFGLAKALCSPDLTISGQTIGTPLYVSPEQFRGETSTTDGRTDVYSLGATIYDVIAGVPPFRANDVGGLYRMVQDERPPPIPSGPADMPRDLDRVLQAALEKRPEDRYASAAALRDDLLALADGERVRGRPLAWAARALRRIWRRRWTAAGLAALALAGTVWSTTRAATLRVTSFPPAAVTIDGELRGMTPLELEIVAGRHRVRIGRPGFGEFESELDLQAGARRDVHQVLIVGETGEYEAICCLADALGIRIDEDLEPADAPASSPRGTEVTLLPTGDVRTADLVTWSLHVPSGGAAHGLIALRRGAERLYEEPVVLADGAARGAFPITVTHAMRAGDELVLSWHPEGGPEAQSRLQVATEDVERQLQEITERLSEQPASVVRHLRAEVLLGRGLALSAYLEAAGIKGAGACEERAARIRGAALRRLQLQPEDLQRAYARPETTPGLGDDS